LALQFHPDKNAAPGASEAFKLIGTAFGTLSDTDKRRSYDLYGMESTRRPSASAQTHGHFGGGRQNEMSAEELFNLFFGGGSPFHASGFTLGSDGNMSFRQGGLFDEGDLFDMGGFSSQRHRQRQRERRREMPGQQGRSWILMLIQWLPLILIIFSSSLSSLVSWMFSSPPSFAFEPTNTFTLHRKTYNRQIPYYMTPNVYRQSYHGNRYRLTQLEDHIETVYISRLHAACEQELQDKQRRMIDARWFGDQDTMAKIQQTPLASCTALEKYKK
jgi:DnaJ homolog subfamily B member 12